MGFIDFLGTGFTGFLAGFESMSGKCQMLFTSSKPKNGK